MNQIVIRGEIASNLKKYKIGEESYMSFHIAVECKNRNTGASEMNFMACEAWGQTAENIYRQFRRKDDIVIIGELRSREFDERKRKHHHRIVVSEACFTCGSLVRRGV